MKFAFTFFLKINIYTWLFMFIIPYVWWQINDIYLKKKKSTFNCCNYELITFFFFLNFDWELKYLLQEIIKSAERVKFDTLLLLLLFLLPYYFFSLFFFLFFELILFLIRFKRRKFFSFLHYFSCSLFLFLINIYD